MKKVFVDTNVLVDLLANRKPWIKEAQELITAARGNQFYLYFSALTIANLHYVVLRKLPRNEANNILQDVRKVGTVISLDASSVDAALNDIQFSDYEDALQYFSALQSGMDVIITRNLKHFKHSRIPCMTAGEFLSSRK